MSAPQTEAERRQSVVEVWSALELAICAAVQLTPTQWLSSRQWAVIEVMMRETEKTIAELRNGGAANEKDNGNG